MNVVDFEVALTDGISAVWLINDIGQHFKVEYTTADMAKINLHLDCGRYLIIARNTLCDKWELHSTNDLSHANSIKSKYYIYDGDMILYGNVVEDNFI